MSGWLARLPQPLRGCYEAGPTGFALYRAAEAAGLAVEVIAPSKTPRASSDKIKTDRKDAELWARLLLAGQLKAVAVPPPAFEAARHLACAREQVRGDLMRCRHRVSKLLLLHGRVYDASAWTKTHRRWLEQQRFDQAATELAYLDTLAAVDGLVARKAALDERLSRLAREGDWWPTVARLRCFRGIDTLTAFVLCLEVGDWTRFPNPAKLASWLGLVPSLDQSGESRRQGAITKTGSGHARRLLVEAAWHYLPRPSAGPAIAERRAGQPDHVLQIALRAQRRLHRHYHRLRERGKPANVTTVAIARELACFLGAAAVADQPPSTAACSGGHRATCCRHARLTYGQPSGPRPFLDSARRRRNQGNGVANPRIIRLTARDRRRRARRPPAQQTAPISDRAMRPGPLTRTPPYQYRPSRRA